MAGPWIEDSDCCRSEIPWLEQKKPKEKWNPSGTWVKNGTNSYGNKSHVSNTKRNPFVFGVLIFHQVIFLSFRLAKVHETKAQ